jgi:serine/threonine protein phosphatase PrpC
MEAEVPKDAATRVTLETWLVTDIGMVREHNEDSAYMDPSHGFFIVADGMGGHAAGEVASAMAVETVRKTLEDQRGEITAFTTAPTDVGRRSLVQLLQTAVLQAHQAVYQRGQNEPDKAGMGTTLDVVVVAGPEAFVAHVGDSRTYLIRDGRTSQITTDHTVAEVLVIEGKLTIEEAQVSPLRTILVNAIGVSADVGVEMAHVTLKRGDRLLLCSDGLHDYFPSDEEIATRLSEEKPGDALKEMVELAKTRGGHDNITGVAVQVIDVGDSVPGTLDGESTQPVDAEKANPFMHDEVTETAFIPGGATDKLLGAKLNEVSQTSIRATQPMRAYAHADTLPPDDGAASAAAGGKLVVHADPKAEPHAATVEAKVPPEVLARAKARASQPPPVGEAAPAAPAAPVAVEDAKSDGTPTSDIATADTGRIQAAAAKKAEAEAAKAEADKAAASAPDGDKTAEMKPTAKPD